MRHPAHHLSLTLVPLKSATFAHVSIIPRTNMALPLATAGYARFRVSLQCGWVLDVIPGEGKEVGRTA